MKAICVTTDRSLETRDVPAPDKPPPGHLVIQIDASAINPGDISFLRQPPPAGTALFGGRHDVWGASGAGRVIAVGEGAPSEFAGRQVAIYRSLTSSPDTVGLWSQIAQIPHTSCAILPESVRARDYCGSLVNVMTAYTFLETAVAEGHKGVLISAGSSATGRAAAAFARRQALPSLSIVRSMAAKEALASEGVEHVIAADGPNFGDQLARQAEALSATAIFDGVGGELLSRIAQGSAMNSTAYVYGFLAGPALLSIPTLLIMAKNLTLKRYRNFEADTVQDPVRLAAALRAIGPMLSDPIFATRVGAEFSFEQIDAAMAYESAGGARAILVA